jgi:hypothetical protein
MAETKLSPRWKLNKKDGKSLLKGFIIMIVGTSLAWGLSQLPNIDFGQYTYIAVPVLGLLFNTGLKWVTNEQGKVV